MTVSNKHSLPDIQQIIQAACIKAKRDPQTLQLLAVSKTQSSDAIRSLYQKGLHRFGENYCQEALSKITELADLQIEWHFIGPIQSNKTRLIAENFDWVHTLDRLKIAQRLSEQRPPNREPIQACVQINIDQESSKSGILPADLMELLKACQNLKGIKIRGLMCIPKADEDPEPRFKQMAALLAQAQQVGFELDTLSMGMSSDFESAIDAGATIIRLGTALFGNRQQKL